FESLGMVMAVSGFVYLLLPGADVPPLGPAGLMAVSGVAWGLYSLLGQGAAEPIQLTSRNFVINLLWVIPLAGIFSIELSYKGWLWAVLSGSITSGIGYVMWYMTLKRLQTNTAAIVQLSVPAITAFGGVLFLSESISMRLIVASVLILGGIAIKVLFGHKK
ncbi:MAG: DMT family transporter, partial [Pseudomonadota bacterium]